MVTGPSGADVRAWVAASCATRLLGLALLASLPPGSALLIPRCRSVHTFGMRFAIDVVFVSWPPNAGVSRVIGVRERLDPLRMARMRAAGPVAALELPASGARQLGLARAGLALRFEQ